jgi:hypothetical protein
LLSIVTLLHNNTAKAQPKITPAMPHAKFTSKMALGNNISTHYVIGSENNPLMPVHNFLPEVLKHFIVPAPVFHSPLIREQFAGIQIILPGFFLDDRN